MYKKHAFIYTVLRNIHKISMVLEGIIKEVTIHRDLNLIKITESREYEIGRRTEKSGRWDVRCKRVEFRHHLIWLIRDVKW